MMAINTIQIDSVELRKKDALKRGQLLVDWVEDELRQTISRQAKSQKAKIPHEHTLAKSYDVSINTVRNALERLKKERLIRSVKGKGTFIVPRNKKTGEILVLSPRPHHPYFIMGSNVLNRILSEEGFTPKLLQGDNPLEQMESMDSMENLAGVILLVPPSNDYVRNILRRVDVPVVCIGDVEESASSLAICDTVLGSRQGKILLATEYLIRQGHRNIAVATWGLNSTNGKDFLLAYQIALEKHGVAFHEEWCINLPRVHFGEPNREDLYHQSLGEMQKQIDQWFEPGAEAPTALIHAAASEMQVRDINHYYFHDHFAPKNIMGLATLEYLPITFNGLGPATAVCSSFEHLVRRALELLFRPRYKNTLPVREFHEEICLYKRENGIWTPRPFEVVEESKDIEKRSASKEGKEG